MRDQRPVAFRHVKAVLQASARWADAEDESVGNSHVDNGHAVVHGLFRGSPGRHFCCTASVSFVQAPPHFGMVLPTGNSSSRGRTNGPGVKMVSCPPRNRSSRNGRSQRKSSLLQAGPYWIPYVLVGGWAHVSGQGLCHPYISLTLHRASRLVSPHLTDPTNTCSERAGSGGRGGRARGEMVAE